MTTKVLRTAGCLLLTACGGAIAADGTTDAASDAGLVVTPAADAASPIRDAGSPPPPPPPPSPGPFDERCGSVVAFGPFRPVTPRWVVGSPPPATGGIVGDGPWMLVEEIRYLASGPARSSKPALSDREVVLDIRGAQLRMESRYRRVTTTFTIEEVHEYAVGLYSTASVRLTHDPRCTSAPDVLDIGGVYSATGDTLTLHPGCAGCGYEPVLVFKRR